ncbi:MAG: kynureninase [Armatimonadota bacterium]
MIPNTPFRDRHLLPEGLVYLDGNSLGAATRDAVEAVRGAVDDWVAHRIEGWTEGNAPWLFLAERLGDRVGALVGAAPGTVVATGSITVNLHQLLATLWDGRGRILVDSTAFPTDRYAIESHVRLRGLDPEQVVEAIASGPDGLLDDAAIVARLSEFAVAVLPSVVYTTGQLLEMGRITAAGRASGTLVLWDCAHSMGVVPHHFDRDGVDGAYWCHYKWCGAGPGAVGGLYLGPRHHGRAPGIAGWFGGRKEGLFRQGAPFDPADGAYGLQTGTTHVFSLAALDGSLRPIEEAGMEWIRSRSLALTDHLLLRAVSDLVPLGVGIATPRDRSRRGGHIALIHPAAGALCRAMRARGIVPDHRPPDHIRLAPSALHNDVSDIDRAIDAMADLLRSGVGNEPCASGLVP